MNGRLSKGISNRISQYRPAVIRAMKGTVAKNAASLYSIQFASYVLPLITIPYLVRVLRPERYGTVAFGQGLMAYFMVIVDYGFALSATRRISASREDRDLVSRIAFNVIGARVLLCAVSFLLLLGSIHFVPRLHEVASLLYVLFGSVVGTAIFPSWLFQGLERMTSLTVINFSVRIVAILAMFVVVRQESDYLAYAALISAQSLLAGVVGIWVALRLFNLQAVWPSWSGIIDSLKDGWVTFLSMSAVTLYTSGNAFILGMLTNDVVVGFYSAGDRIVRAALAALGPLSQAAYPRFSKMAVESKEKTLLWARRMLLFMAGVGLLSTFGILVMAPWVVKLVLGARFLPSVAVLRILSPLCFLIAVTNVLGIQILFPFKKERAVLVSVVWGGLANVALAFMLAPKYQANGMALSALLAEMAVTAVQIYYIAKSGLNPLRTSPEREALVPAAPGIGGLEI